MSSPTVKWLATGCFLLAASWCCREKYVPDIPKTETNLLVVEGDILNGAETSILLSRTSDFTKRDTIPELKATVEILGAAGGAIRLAEQGKGFYKATLNLDTARDYRLHITTATGKEYLTDPIHYQYNPVIDSINFVKKGDGAWIYANTHDDQRRTDYYRWTFVEDWEFHSAYPTTFTLSSGSLSATVVDRSAAEIPKFFVCYQHAISTDIVLGSAASLATSTIYESPLLLIPNGSIKLTILYSILVNQFALNKTAYNYWQLLRKNTEKLGSIFDAQPSDVPGNVHSVKDPSERVIGFISATNAISKRIFIKISDVSPWFYTQNCYDSVATDARIVELVNMQHVPLLITYSAPEPHKYYVTDTACADCRLRGSSVRPSFFP